MWREWQAEMNKNLTAAICDHYLVNLPAVRHRNSGREARALAEFSGKLFLRLACLCCRKKISSSNEPVPLLRSCHPNSAYGVRCMVTSHVALGMLVLLSGR